MLVDTKPTIFTCGHQPCHVCELWLRNYIPARNFNVSFSISCFSHNYSGSFLSIFLANVFVVTLLIWVLYINICIFLLLFLEYFFFFFFASAGFAVRGYQPVYLPQWNTICTHAEPFVSVCYSESIAMSFFMFIHALCYGKPTTQTDWYVLANERRIHKVELLLKATAAQ